MSVVESSIYEIYKVLVTHKRYANIVQCTLYELIIFVRRIIYLTKQRNFQSRNVLHIKITENTYMYFYSLLYVFIHLIYIYIHTPISTHPHSLTPSPHTHTHVLRIIE